MNRIPQEPAADRPEADESTFSSCRRQTSELVQSNPAIAVAAGFGAGLGLGLLVGFSLVRDHGRSHASFEMAAVSRRVLEQLRAHVPDVVRKYMEG